MAVTREQALSEYEFHRGECTRTHGPRGGVRELTEHWRRNGEPQTWKRSPDRFKVPVKYGMRGYDYLTEDNASEFHTAKECPLEEVEYREASSLSGRFGPVIEVSKVGGGTLGKRYDGRWEVRVIHRGKVRLDEELTTGTPKTHAEVADMAMDFLDGP